MRRTSVVLGGLLLGACAIPNTIAGLDTTSPPPAFGRPGWVRFCGSVGAWVGGLAGGVVSIVTLPVTYPISLLAGDGLADNGKSEFLLFPAMAGAAIGHGPSDSVDYVFRRAWVGGGASATTYDHVPMQPAALPRTRAAEAPAQQPAVKGPGAPGSGAEGSPAGREVP